MIQRIALLSAILFSTGANCALKAQAEAKTDSRYPYRTDFANENMPWYQLQPTVFPPMHADRRISGELVGADYVHRRGRFRTIKDGTLVDFTMLPFATFNHLNTPSDIREVPLGTDLLFFLFQDEHGAFTKMSNAVDDYSILAGHGSTYRLDEVKPAEGKLLVTRQSLPKKQLDQGKAELLIKKETRFWKGDQQIPLNDLKAGDALLANLTGRSGAQPGWCTDIWVGDETHRQLTDRQRDKYLEFVKVRGIPGWIDKVEDPLITVTLFGDPHTASKDALEKMIADTFVLHKGVYVAVANQELRTYNPPVDQMISSIMEIQKGEYVDGNSGIRLVLKPRLMLEGMRKGHIVRIFGAGWKVQDMDFGESLSAYRRTPCAEMEELRPRDYPEEFPFRTDYGNAHLPWYQLQPGKVPPAHSAHVVIGELVKVDAAKRAGQFRTDRTGELVDFTLTAEGGPILRYPKPKVAGSYFPKELVASVLHLDADANLADIPLGTRCRFYLYQDEKGVFSKAAQVMDEYSCLALNHLTYRVTALPGEDHLVRLARQIVPVQNPHQSGLVRPPDVGQTEYLVDDTTKVWKGMQQVKLNDLAVDDEVLVNLSGEAGTTNLSHCTEIWVGTETHDWATAEQQKKHGATAQAK